MNIRYVTTSSGSSFKLSRTGSLRATVNDDGWRDWPLTGADFQLYSETWNRGDQNGGSPLNKVYMQLAKFGRNSGGLGSFTFPNPCNAGRGGDEFADEYSCSDLTGNVARDGFRTWTKDR
jgi:hypothetical protein